MKIPIIAIVAILALCMAPTVASAYTFFISVHNEENTSEPAIGSTANPTSTWFYIEIFNGTKTLSPPVNRSHSATGSVANYTGDWSGPMIVTVYANNYTTRRYSFLMTSNFTLETTLLKQTSGNWIRFHVTDVSGNPLPNVTINASLWSTTTETGNCQIAPCFLKNESNISSGFGNRSGWLQDELQTTDSSGSIAMFLNPNVLYSLRMGYAGTLWGNMFQVNPTFTDYWLIYNPNSTVPWNMTNWTSATTPGINFNHIVQVCPSNNTTLFFYIEPDPMINYYGFDVSVGNVSVGNNTSATPGLVNLTNVFNFTALGYTGGIARFTYYYNVNTTQPRWNVTTVPLQAQNHTYAYYTDYQLTKYACYPSGYYNTSIANIANKINSGAYAVPCYMLLIISLFISIIITSAAVSIYTGETGMVGTTLIFVVCLLIFDALFPCMLQYSSFQAIVLLAALFVLWRLSKGVSSFK